MFAGPKRNPRDTSGCSQNSFPKSQNRGDRRESKSRHPFFRSLLGLSKGATPKLMITYGLMMAAYIAYLFVWYPRRMRRRLIRCWETYDLEIGHDYLLRRQADIPDLRLQFDEVQVLLYVVMIWATSPAVVIPLSLVMGSVIVSVFFWIRRNPYFSTNQSEWLDLLVVLLIVHSEIIGRGGRY